METDNRRLQTIIDGVSGLIQSQVESSQRLAEQLESGSGVTLGTVCKLLDRLCDQQSAANSLLVELTMLAARGKAAVRESGTSDTGGE